MIKVVHWFLALSCAVVLSGCMSSPSRSTADPEWLIEPPANTEHVLYGVGSGRTLAQANKAALANLIERLGVSIASSYEESTNIRNNRYNSKAQQEIRSKADNIRVSNSHTEQTARIRNGQVAVLVSSQRQPFVQELEQQIQQTLERNRRRLAQAANSHALERYMAANRAVKEVEQSRFNIAVLNSLAVSARQQNYAASLGKLENQANTFKSGLFFTVSAGNRQLSNALTEALNANGFVVKNFGFFDNNKITIKATANVDYTQQYGLDMVQYHLLLETQDSKGQTIASKNWKFVGKGAGGKNSAIENALEQFQATLTEQGLEATLGLQFSVK